MKFFDRVAVTTATTGPGTITLGAVLDTNFFTFAEQGAVDADTVYYMINEGGDVEIGEGTLGGTVSTLSRDTVLSSRISGVAGTSKMDLGGAAQVRCIAASEAFDLSVRTDIPQPLSAAQQAQGRANLDVGILAGFRNKIINGGFDIWQRATSQTSSGLGSDDRWFNGNIGTTKTHSRVAFTFGQTGVPGNPEYFSRTAVVSSAGSGNAAFKFQRIEGVQSLSGMSATVSFWAKADASKNMAVELRQNFGSGGSPSSAVEGIGAQHVALSTAWQKFSVVFDVPSVSGKTLGSDGKDALELVFWFDAGSTFNGRTASLGQQSGTFDLARVSLVDGDARAEADPFSPRHIQQEEDLCDYFFGYVSLGVVGHVATSSTVRIASGFRLMRAAPTMTLTTSSPGILDGNGGVIASGATLSGVVVSRNGFRAILDGFTGLTAGRGIQLLTEGLISREAEL